MTYYVVMFLFRQFIFTGIALVTINVFPVIFGEGDSTIPLKLIIYVAFISALMGNIFFTTIKYH